MSSDHSIQIPFVLRGQEIAARDLLYQSRDGKVQFHYPDPRPLLDRIVLSDQAHPDAARMSEIKIAQSFAEAVTAAVYIEHNTGHGQIVREIVEVSTVVEPTAARPSFSPLFKYEAGKGLVPTGNRPMRPGFRAKDLNIPETIFKLT